MKNQTYTTTCNNTTARIFWVDLLKAIFGFYIVFQHTYVLILSDNLNDVFHCLNRALIPWFYFFSGFFASISFFEFKRRRFKTQVMHKFRRLFIPAAIFIILLSPDSTTIKSVLTGNLGGNYFVGALFFIFVFNYSLSYLTVNVSNRIKAYVFISGATVTSCALAFLHDSDAGRWLEWRDFMYGNMFFVAGIISKRFDDKLIDILLKPTCALISGTIYISSWYMHSQPDIMHPVVYKFINCIVMPFSGIMLATSAGLHLGTSRLSQISKIRNIASYMGQRSLATYIISWLFIFQAKELLHSSGIEPDNLITTACAIIIYILSLSVYDIIIGIPHVGNAVFGKKKVPDKIPET